MPKIKYILLFLTLQLGFTFCRSQTFEEELKTAVSSKPKAEFRMDSRHSFINQKGVKTVGFKVGVQFAEKLSFGIGYNQLWSPISTYTMHNGLKTKVNLAYHNFSPYTEYVFFRDDKWELSIPLQFGFGSSYYLNKTEIGEKRLKKEFVVSYEPAITVQYRLLKYFGLGMGIGYRFMIISNGQLEEKFTSPVFIFKTRIYFQDILKDLNFD